MYYYVKVDPTLSVLVQKMAFNAGYRWGVSGTQVKHEDKCRLYFNGTLGFRGISYSNKEPDKKDVEIPQDKIWEFFNEGWRPQEKIINTGITVEYDGQTFQVKYNRENEEFEIGCARISLVHVKNLVVIAEGR